MTEQLITMILSLENIILFAFVSYSESLQNWLLFSLHVIVIFRKNFTCQLATENVSCTRQSRFLLSFDAWLALILGPVYTTYVTLDHKTSLIALVYL